MDTRKILMVNTSRGFIGGVERLMVSLSKGLREAGWHVFGLFEQTFSEDPAFDVAFDGFEVRADNDINSLIVRYKELGISHVCIHKTTKSEWVRRLRECFITVVIVHDHDYYCLRRHKYYPVIRKNCKLAFSRLGCSLCSGMLDKTNGKLSVLNVDQRVKLLQALVNCDLSFVLSDYMGKNLSLNGWESRRIKKLIPYQPIPEKNAAQMKEYPVILYVGQLVRGKGVDLLLKALAQVSETYRCIIAGHGNDEEFLRSLTNSLHLHHKVRFIGWSKDISQIYAQSDIVVVPSRWQEPFGLVGLEAFSCKKPVVAFDNGGISQWLKHGINGLLVTPNDIMGFANSLTLLLRDDELRSRLGHAGYQQISQENTYFKFLESFQLPLESLGFDR